MSGLVFLLSPLSILLGIAASQLWMRTNGYEVKPLSIGQWVLVLAIASGLGFGFQVWLVGPAWLAALICGVLIFLAYTDMRTQKLPDIGNLALLVLAGLSLLILKPISWQMAGIGMIAGFLCLYGVNLIYRTKTGHSGIGQGDMKLMGAAGALLGPTAVFHVLLVGSVVTLIASQIMPKPEAQSEKQKIPFGPGLCLGILTVWIYNWVRGQGGI